MDYLLLIAIITISIILIVVMLITIRYWSKQNKVESKLEEKYKWGKTFSRKMKASLIQLIIGLVIVLLAAVLMFDGHILGEKTIQIAKIIGSIGLGLILTCFIRYLPGVIPWFFG